MTILYKSNIERKKIDIIYNYDNKRKFRQI